MNTKLSTPKSFQDVLDYARKHGQQTHPLLSAQYSSGTRVPSIDLTPFIIQWLRSGNLDLIGDLMAEVLAGNPGLGVRPDWIRKDVERAVKLPFQHYIQFADEKDFDELRALWIVSSKDGSGSKFWITGETPTILSYAVATLFPRINKSFHELAERANRFILDMGKDALYWRDYPPFDFDAIEIEPIPETPVAKIIREMPISARLHLFSAIKTGCGSLPKMTNYAIRNFGIVISDTTRQIIDANLFIPASDSDSMAITMSKDELFALCTQAGIKGNKSWNKHKLASAIKEHRPDLFDDIIREETIVVINPDVKDHLEALNKYSKSLVSFLKALCFI